MKADVQWEALFRSIRDNDWPGSIKNIDSIIDSDRGNPNLYLKKGDICLKAGDKAEAVNSYLKAAWYLGNEGFLKKSLAVYKLVLRYDPDNDQALHESNRIMMDIDTISESQKKPEQTVPSSDETHRETEKTAGDTSSPALQQQDQPAAPLTESGTPSPPGFLSYFTSSEIEEILGRASVGRFSDGWSVVREGDSGDSVYIIKNGSADVVGHFPGKVVILDTLSAGDLFGEIAFLTGRTRTASVIAKGDLEVYEFKRPLLEELASRRPQILSQLSSIYIKRVKDTLSKVKSKK